MRYQPAHAAPRDSVPPQRRVPKPLKTGLSVAMAGIFGLVPAVMIASPANALPRDFLQIADAGTYAGQVLTFTLVYTGTTAATFDINTTGGNADPGVDFGPLTSESDNDDGDVNNLAITFAAASASAPVSADVTVTTTDGAPPDKTFTLRADPVSGNDVTATGTIWETPDPFPTYTFLAQSPVPESQAAVTVTATLSAVSPHDVTIPVQTAASSDVNQSQATSTGGVNRDFTALASNAAIVIEAGQLSGSINVNLWDDSVDEPTTQYFSVQSSGTDVGGATALNGSFESVDIGITDNDAAPTVSIGNATGVVEGGNAVFPVTLSSLSETAVTVNVLTASGADTPSTLGATDGTDYDATDRTITIPPYNRSVNVLVHTNTDLVLEGTETFKATLRAPTEATLGLPMSATGTILDGNFGPGVALDSDPDQVGPQYTFPEGATGEVETTIRVYNENVDPAQVPLMIDYAFVDGTAVNGVDYRGTSGSILVPAGSDVIEATIPVTIIGDRYNEDPDETFDVVLTSPNGTISPNPGDGLGATTFTITEGLDDVESTWTTGDVSVVEGDSGVTMARVPLRLSGPTGGDVTFSASLAGGAIATEGGVNSGTTVGADDFDLPNVRTVVLPAGSSSAYIDIPINGDAIYERDEAFILSFTATGGGISQDMPIDLFHSSRVTITNDDAKPVVSFNELSAAEGSTVRIIGTTTGLSQYAYSVGLSFGPTGQNPATLVTDYDVPSPLPTFTILRGKQGVFTDPVVEVYFAADNLSEGVETFGVTATENSVSLIGLAPTMGVYKIYDPEIPTGPVDPTDPTDIPAPSIVVPATRIGVGTVKIAGTTTTQGSVVELWGGSWTTPAIEKIDEVVAGEGGDYTFNKSIAMGWRFAVRANSKWSTLKYVRIIQLPALGASSAGLKGVITLAVQGNPKATGQTVIVQRWTNTGKWITAAKGTTGPDSRWSAVLRPIPSGSSWTFRAFVVTDTGTGTLGGFSVTKMVIVK
jgi:hypothetical protein